MKVYGFSSAKQIFTIWEVSYTYENIDRNRRYKVSTYKYCGRTSEKHEKLDPNTNNRLRSFSKKDIEFTNVNTFRFGKYVGKNIEEVKDLKYTRWYFEIITDEDHKKFIKDFLWENWHEFRTNWEGKEYAVSPETLKKEEEKNKKVEFALAKAKRNASVLLEITGNPNHEGRVFVDDIPYYFGNVVKRYYQGWEYYMPTKNGQAKRVKNKVIKANLMEIDGKIFIANFTIVK